LCDWFSRLTSAIVSSKALIGVSTQLLVSQAVKIKAIKKTKKRRSRSMMAMAKVRLCKTSVTLSN
jgi:hypothetical protein